MTPFFFCFVTLRAEIVRVENFCYAKCYVGRWLDVFLIYVRLEKKRQDNSNIKLNYEFIQQKKEKKSLLQRKTTNTIQHRKKSN